MLYKKSYFQGTEEPAPKKKKYKSEPAIVVQPRFKEPLFKNYDLYDTPGVEDGKPAKHGPGKGWHSMHEYKSIKDFLDAKRKKMKDKYKADDSWIQDDGTLSKSPKKSKANIRMKWFSLIKNGIDFPIDDQTTPMPFDYDQMEGLYDKYLNKDDFEGKSQDKLNFGRDYENEDTPANETEKSGLLGLPDGVNEEAEDNEFVINNINPEYGETNSGNTSYDEN